MNNYNFVAPCLFGVESILAGELRRLDIENVRAENGRVLFSGNASTIARANINSRFAERILINVASFKATSFAELFDYVKAVDWQEYIGKFNAFPVKGWSLNSALFSIPDCQSIIKKAIVEKLKMSYKTDWFEETGAVVSVQFSILKDEVTIMIDTSGPGLHKRGYRANSNDAPIKETLAASMCDIARIFPDTTIYDPFCGSGTILIEAAMMAKKMAPGLKRYFAAERYDFLSPSIWSSERTVAMDKIEKNVDFKAIGYDIDPAAVKLTLENAKKAGVENLVSVSVADVKDFTMNEGRGIVVTNPPYGERLLDIRMAEDLYKTMGQVFVENYQKRYFVISPHDEFEKHFGRFSDKKRKLYNGMIKCNLNMYIK